MKFQKGNKLGGRTKGSCNKVNQPIRNRFLMLLEDNMDQMQNDLDGLEPKDRLKLLIDISAFCVPKLKAIELTTAKDELSNTQPVTIEFISDADNN